MEHWWFRGRTTCQQAPEMGHGGETGQQGRPTCARTDRELAHEWFPKTITLYLETHDPLAKYFR
jgi:hypothetical protein